MLNLWIKVLNIREKAYANIKVDTEVNNLFHANRNHQSMFAQFFYINKSGVLWGSHCIVGSVLYYSDGYIGGCGLLMCLLFTYLFTYLFGLVYFTYFFFFILLYLLFLFVFSF